MTREEIQLIDDTFLLTKERVLVIFDTKKNLGSSTLFKELLLYQEFKDLPSHLPELFLSLPLDKYVLEKIDYLVDELEKEIIIKSPSKNLSPTLKSKRIEYWHALKLVLLDTHKKISEEIYDSVFLEDKPKDDIKLNRSQIALLMLYLRDNKAIMNLPDLQIAKQLAALTGYSYKQLRLKVVSDAKSERNLMTILILNHF
jgi:hypothetical protein